jgi:hypothetical protein
MQFFSLGPQHSPFQGRAKRSPIDIKGSGWFRFLNDGTIGQGPIFSKRNANGRQAGVKTL